MNRCYHFGLGLFLCCSILACSSRKDVAPQQEVNIPGSPPTRVVPISDETRSSHPFQLALKQIEDGKSHDLDCRKMTRINDQHLGWLAESSAAAKIRSLNLEGISVSDKGIAQLPFMPNLERFEAAKTAFGDSALLALKDKANLQVLVLDQSRVSNKGIATIAQMKSLRRLSLWKCAITDEGLQQLRDLPQLAELSLDETLVSMKGVSELMKTMPQINRIRLWRTRVKQDESKELQKLYPALRIHGQGIDPKPEVAPKS
jgi:hypothetical protein